MGAAVIRTAREQFARALHHQFTPLMAAIAGVPVEPAYTYTVMYEAGAELPRQLPHYRHRLPAGCRSTSILLHYVATSEGHGW